MPKGVYERKPKQPVVTPTKRIAVAIREEAFKHLALYNKYFQAANLLEGGKK